MSDQDSVTQWINGVKTGDEAAAAELWNRCFDDLVRMARNRFGTAPRRVHDEEDAAISVFASLCRGAADGRFERLQTRDDLWPLLVALTRQKVVDKIRSETRQKRGGGQVRGESVFLLNADEQNAVADINNFAGGDLSPELETELNDAFRTVLSELGDENMRRIARLRLEGYTNDEIGAQLQISEASVRRKIRLIRDTWTAICDDV